MAGRHLAGMSDEQKTEVTTKLNNNLKKQSNKTVKAAVVHVQYAERAQTMFVEPLRSARRTPQTMVHGRKKTLWEEYGVLASVKVGDWVSVIECYEIGICSDGGIGSVTAVIATAGAVVAVTAVSVKYVLTGNSEMNISIARVMVVPMPFKND
jgi:hypothetical protein